MGPWPARVTNWSLPNPFAPEDHLAVTMANLRTEARNYNRVLTRGP
jgi:hypothetical protein